MHVVRVGEVEDRLLEFLHGVVHFMRLDFRSELREVIYSALSMGCRDDMMGILTDVLGDLTPGGLDSSDRIGECAVLKVHTGRVSSGSLNREMLHTMSKRTASALKDLEDMTESLYDLGESKGVVCWWT